MAQIHDAADSGDDSQVKRLLAAGADVNAPAEDGWQPLNIAALQGRTAVAECLIKAGANTNATSPGGFRPLFNAAQGGHLAIVKLLVANRAEIDARSDDGGTALYNAALNGHADVVDFLIGAGAEVDAQANNGGTPLGVAAEQAHLAVVQLLVGKGANIAAANNDGFTPLHMAAQKGHKEVAFFLLEHGADVDRRNTAGSTPDDIAHLHGHPELVELIAGRRVKKPEAGTYCSKCGRGVIMSWTCPKCHELLCDTCSGMTTTKPELHDGFTVQTFGGGNPTCPYCERVPSLVTADILDLAKANRKIEAIKLYMERTGQGLKQSKEAVEAMLDEPPQTGQGPIRQSEILPLLRGRGRPGHIDAVRLWRQRTGQGLKESVEAVNKIAQANGLPVEPDDGSTKSPGRAKRGCLIGCGGAILVVLALVSIAVAGMERDKRQIGKTIPALLSELTRVDPRETYKTTSLALRSQYTPEAFAQLVENLNIRHYASWAMKDARVGSSASGSAPWLIRGYVIADTGASQPIEMGFVKEEGAWRLMTLRTWKDQ